MQGVAGSLGRLWGPWAGGGDGIEQGTPYLVRRAPHSPREPHTRQECPVLAKKAPTLVRRAQDLLEGHCHSPEKAPTFARRTHHSPEGSNSRQEDPNPGPSSFTHRHRSKRHHRRFLLRTRNISPTSTRLSSLFTFVFIVGVVLSVTNTYTGLFLILPPL